jgi:hypothetical protein
MNKKAQGGPIAFILLIMVFNILWFVWLGGFISDVGAQAISTNSLTGVEAFFYANLNMVIFIAEILGIMGYLYFIGGA